MAALVPVVTVLTGVNPGTPDNASAGGDTFPVVDGARYLIRVINGHSAPQAVVIDDPNSVGPQGGLQFNPDVSVSVTNGQERVIRVDYPNRFKNTSGNISLSYPDGVTALTLKVYRV